MENFNLDLFSEARLSSTPAGFNYSAELVERSSEARLVLEIQKLSLFPYEFRGVKARRRVASFGFRHGYQSRRLEKTADIPAFLKSLRTEVAEFAHIAPEGFQQVLVSEYTPGTPIGWHRDREHYDQVVGVSLLSTATLRFRRPRNGGWTRQSQILAPRSVYLLSGAARSQWQHSIPAVEALRYSITFRTLRDAPARTGP